MPFREPTNPLFAQLFAGGWNRLEARSRRDDFAAGLAATLADPLWALGRQMQLLELKGDEAGTPIQVDLTYEEVALDKITLGDGPIQDIGPIPVEVLVEREAVAWDWRMRVRAGQHFERLVGLDPTLSGGPDDDLIRNLRVSSPVALPSSDTSDWLEMDYAARRFVSLMAGRVIDGKDLWERLSAGNVAGVSASLRKQFLDWYDALYSQGPNPSPAWNPEQLDYEFRIHATDTTAPGPVHAPSYRNGSIDWDAFVLERPSTRGFTAKEPLQLTPVHVTFAGQPHAAMVGVRGRLDELRLSRHRKD
jgi:hypothetical protein